MIFPISSELKMECPSLIGPQMVTVTVESPTSPIQHILASLPLLDLEVGPNDENVDFDHKHFSKGLRKCLIGGSFKRSFTLLSPNDLRVLLSSTNSLKDSIDALINPDDKQNVS